MQALCIPSHEDTDVECTICGARFTLAWSHKADAEKPNSIQMVMNELAQQHMHHRGASAHSKRPFTVPAWSGPAHMSGAALLGFLPARY